MLLAKYPHSSLNATISSFRIFFSNNKELIFLLQDRYLRNTRSIVFLCVVHKAYLRVVTLWGDVKGKEKAMAPHSSTPAWRIPWMEEPGRLQSMGSLRVRHDWGNLAGAVKVTIWYLHLLCGGYVSGTLFSPFPLGQLIYDLRYTCEEWKRGGVIYRRQRWSSSGGAWSRLD